MDACKSVQDMKMTPIIMLYQSIWMWVQVKKVENAIKTTIFIHELSMILAAKILRIVINDSSRAIHVTSSFGRFHCNLPLAAHCHPS